MQLMVIGAPASAVLRGRVLFYSPPHTVVKTKKVVDFLREQNKTTTFAAMQNLDTLYGEWLAVQPLAPDTATRLERKFVLDFNYNSNHIEGNTLTYGQTEVLLMLGQVDGPARMRDLEEMKAHHLCLAMMREQAAADMPLTENFIRQLHHTMLRDDYTMTRAQPGGATTSYTIHAGRYKTRPNSVVTATGELFAYAAPEETPALMHDLVEWYNAAETDPDITACQLAALLHYRYIRIHPFEDGNGRIARLLANYCLLRRHYPMLVVRSDKKEAYLQALARTDLATGPVPADGAHATAAQCAAFIAYVEQLMAATLRDNLRMVRHPDQLVWWLGGQMLNFRSPTTPRLLTILARQPRATIASLAEELGINASAVQKQIKNMTTKGYITRTGTPKQWRVLAQSTE